MRRPSLPEPVRTVGIVLLGVLMLAVAGWVVSEVVRYPTLDRAVAGEVVAKQSGKGCSSEVEFVVDGERRTTTWNGCGKAVGREVTVRYDGDDPSRATADGWRRTLFVRLPISLLMAGLGALCVAQVRGLLRRRRG